MHTFLIILPSSNILVKLPNLLTCGDKALTSPTKHWYSTVPPIAWLPSFVGLHNGTKLRRGCSFFSQWHLVVCYHHSETDPNLKPIFSVQSSTKSVEAMHSLMMIIRHEATAGGQPSFKNWPDVKNQICHRWNMPLWLSKRDLLFHIVKWRWAFVKLLYISFHCNSIPGYGITINFHTYCGSINVLPYANLLGK